MASALKQVKKSIDETFKILRGSYPVWPPVANKNEEEGCAIIESMMCERYQSTLREPGLSPNECKRVDLEGRGGIPQGFECWKSFAAERSTKKLSSSSAAHSDSEQRHSELVSDRQSGAGLIFTAPVLS